MQTSAGDRGKAQSIFRSVFVELGVKWIGPKYDFNLDVYEARIESGMMKGRSLSIPYERLQDSDVSAESIKQDLLTQLK